MPQLPTTDRLHLFVARAEELEQRRLLSSNGLQVKSSISWDADSDASTTTLQEPDEEDLRSFLLLFRQFLSPNEAVFVDRVFNDCFRYLKDEALIEQLNRARDDWRRVLRVGMMKIKVDETDLNADRAFDLWLNGHYIHNDAEKRAELQRHLGDLVPLVRIQFLGCLPGLVRVVRYLAYAVRTGLGQGKFELP